MKGHKNIFLLLSSGGMIVSCFYTCTSFILACISQKPIPVLGATAILLSAAIITYLHSGRGWRRIAVIALHTLGFLFFSLWLYHSYYRLEMSFWDAGWITEFIILNRSFLGWVAMIVIFLGICILWFSGSRLWIKPTDRTTISHRFDLGLGFFLFLLLIKLIIVVKGGSLPVENSLTKSLLAFIVLGLFSMGIVRTENRSQKDHIINFKGVGIILSFIVILLILGGGLFVFFLPGLQTAAEGTYSFLGTFAKPVEQIAVFLLSLFSVYGEVRTGPIEEGEPPLVQVGDEGGILALNASYLILYLTGIFLLALISYFLYRLIKWLFSKTADEKNKRGVWERLLLCIYAVKNLFFALWIRIINRPDTSRAVKKYYRQLLRWGRLSGVEHDAFETSKEYGIRLNHRFPGIENEISSIIHLHDQDLYGCILPTNIQLSHTRLALRKIRNPLLWFVRIKSLLFYNRF